MKKNKKLIILLIIPLLVVLTVSYSKYVHNSVRNYYFKTKGFYFNSENLSINLKKNTNLSWDGNDIHFNLNNFIDDDNITTFDISYRVTCEVLGNNNYTCNLNNTNSSTYEGVLSATSSCINNKEDGVDVSSMTKSECEMAGYDFERQKSTKDMYFNIQTNGDTLEDVEVRITAQTLNKYRQTLTGKYKLHKTSVVGEDISTNYETYENYDKYTISNVSNSRKCVNVSFSDNDLRFDNSVELESYTNGSNNYVNSFVISLNSNEIKELYFYKLDLNKTYSKNDFTINILDHCE